MDRTWVFLGFNLLACFLFVEDFGGVGNQHVFFFVSDIASRDRLEIQVFARVCSKMMGLGGDVNDMLVNLKANRNTAPHVNKI